jgi:hypothetical protein
VQTPFAIVPVWVAELGPHAVLVYFALASYARFDDDRSCHPKVATIAARAGISERSVQMALKALQDGGAITREERTRANGSRRENLYRLRIDRPDPSGSAPQEVRGDPAGRAGPEREDTALFDENSLDEAGRAREAGPEPMLGGGRHVGKVLLGRRFTSGELEIVHIVVRSFNRLAGTKVTLKPREHVRLVLGRVREHPELQASEWDRVIEANLAEPWWDGPPSLNVIFSPRVFHIALERGREWNPDRPAGSKPGRRQPGQSLADLVEMADRLEAEGQ